MSFVSVLLLSNLFVSRIHFVGGLQNGSSETNQLYQQPCLLRVSSKIGLLKPEILVSEGTVDSSVIVSKNLNQMSSLQISHNLEQRVDDTLTDIPKLVDNV